MGSRSVHSHSAFHYVYLHTKLQAQMYIHVGHQAYEPGTEAFHKIVQRFGGKVVGDNGTIDRGTLGRIVFGDKVCLMTAISSESSVYLRRIL